MERARVAITAYAFWFLDPFFPPFMTSGDASQSSCPFEARGVLVPSLLSDLVECLIHLSANRSAFSRILSLAKRKIRTSIISRVSLCGILGHSNSPSTGPVSLSPTFAVQSIDSDGRAWWVYDIGFIRLTLQTPGESIGLVPESASLEVILIDFVREESRSFIRGIFELPDDISIRSRSMSSHADLPAIVISPLYCT